MNRTDLAASRAPIHASDYPVMLRLRELCNTPDDLIARTDRSRTRGLTITQD
jgi:hypothetical protein